MTVLATKAVYRAAEAERFLRLLVEPGQVFEIRALKAFLRGQRRRGTVAGYFNCPAVAAKAIAAIESAAAIYVTLNAVDAAVHARAFNRLKLLEDRDPTTSDANIVRRRWLLVDVDFARPANVSATDAEHQAAIDRAAEIRAALAALGWPEPLYLSSGNGAHLLYRVDLDSNDDGLVDRVLQALNTLYGDDELKVDCSVGNPARITKLVGTLVCKGDDTPDRPHRVSEFIEVPDVLRVVPVEDLNAIVEKAEVFAPADEEDAAGGDHEESHASNNREFDLEAWIDKHCPGAKGPKKTHDGEVWTMPCPWNKEHTGGCAHIIRRKNGKLGAACKHNTCKGKGWQALRDLKEPNRPRPGAFVSNVSSSRKDSQKIEWSQPRALPDELPPVEPFDLDLLPAEFRPWIADISERMQCPPDFPAVASMVVAAGLLGRRIGIRPKRFDNWLVVANLWAMVIGRPGIMKTPAITEPVNVLKRLEIEAKNEYAAEMREFKAAQMVAKVRQKACETEIKNDLKHGGDGMAIATSVIDAESDEPARRRYLVNDTSVEKLGEILGDNPNGVTVFRDELVGLLKSLEKEGQESARAFYLEAWNGTGRHTFDRIVRGTIDIEAAIVSILGGIQPSRLSEYLRAAVHGGTGDDGLMQRFQLAVWPDVSGEWVNVDRWPETAAKKAAFEAYMRLESLDASEIGAEYDGFDDDGIPFLHFSAAAQGRFDAWRGELELRLRSGEEHPAIESHLSKYRSLIPSLALLLHLVDVGRGPVGVEAVEKAIRWGQYLESHARRIYGAAVHAEVPAAKALAKRLLAGVQIGDQPGEFTLRDVYRNAWAGLSTKEEAQAGVDLLVELDWLRPEERPTGGKPKLVFHINPKTWQRAPGGTDKTDKSPPKSPEGTPFDSSVSSDPGASTDFAVPCDFDIDEVNAQLSAAADLREEDLWTA